MTNSKEKIEDIMSEENNEINIVSDAKLLEAGAYFGHRKNMWNPKMKQYIHSTKNGTHIIDIQKTQKALAFAFSFINKIAQKGGEFIFVGTKKQAKAITKEQALRSNSFYVSERWLGGTLTNRKTIFSRVRTMNDLEKLEELNWEGFTKKEGILKKKELIKLQKNLSGIRDMKNVPTIMIVADPMHDLIAIKEAKKSKDIKIIGITDTDCDPTLVDIPIPANDDSVKSLTLILTILADAIVKAKNGEVLFAFQPDEKIILPVDIEKKKPMNSRFGNRNFDNNRDREFKPRNREFKPHNNNDELKKEVK
ncbi:MAG: 30S ribosomal protein S2 [Metamycoplasmataceae bacterium]